MRDLRFWQGKWKDACEYFMLMHIQAGVPPRSRPKLKKLHGHGLNQEYDGHKVFRRRARFLRETVYEHSSAAAARQECLRLIRTKLPFYQQKILELGGKLDSFQFGANFWLGYPQYQLGSSTGTNTEK